MPLVFFATAAAIVLLPLVPVDALVYHFTARDFMPSGCAAPQYKSLWPDQPDWLPFAKRCPIRQDVLQGRASGHPDFELDSAGERQGCSGNAQSLALDPKAPNYTQYAGGTSCVPTHASNLIGSLTKTVEAWLDFHEDGIPKPVYCLPASQRGGRCGWTASNLPTTSGKLLFDKWYRDDAMFNKRVSFDLDLTPVATQHGLFEYMSGDFAPLNTFASCAVFAANQTINCSGGGGGKIWPRGHLESFASPYDEAAPGSDTYGFTTEMHSFFTFAGNETFAFSGDDDVWVYLNEQLALDVGGLHTSTKSVINLANQQVQQRLGLVKGQVYAIDVFHAERKSLGSNFGITTSLQPECGILASGKVVRGGGFSSSQAHAAAPDWQLVGAKWTAARLVLQSREPSLAAYAFLRTRQHVSPGGFVAKFAFTLSRSRSRSSSSSRSTAEGGFAFVLHGDSLVDINGGSGGNMGFRKHLPHSLAVAFEQFGNRVSLIRGGNRTLASAVLMHPNRVDGDGDSKAPHEVEIRYYGRRPNWLEVYLNGGLFLQKRGLDPAGDVLAADDTSAYVGFTSATGVTDDGFDVAVTAFEFRAVTVDAARTRMMQPLPSGGGGGGVAANGRDVIALQVQTFDACGNAIQFGGQKHLLEAWLEREGTSRLRRLSSQDDANSTILGQITDDGEAGQYRVAFSAAHPGQYRVFAKFDSHVFENGTRVVAFAPAGLATVAPSPPPPANDDDDGASMTPFIILGASLASVCGLFCILFGVGLGYRRRWREGKRFIPAGREAEAERDVQYHAGDAALDEYKRRVEQSFHALNFERSKQLNERAQRQQLLDDIAELRQHIAGSEVRKMGKVAVAVT